MQITAINANWNNYNNYAYFVELNEYNLLVDAGDFEKINLFLEQKNKRLDYILITHKDPDHIDGAKALKEKYNARLIASTYSSLSYADMNEHDIAHLGLSFKLLPGHRADSSLWMLDVKNKPFALFTGDVIFSCGCGRQFQRTDERLLVAMKYINSLDGRYQLCTGHEYTLTNVEFCLEHFPYDEALQNYFHEVQSKDMVREPTMPIKLQKEKQINPFLRYNEDKLWHAINAISPLDFVVKLRNLRDQY